MRWYELPGTGRLRLSALLTEVVAALGGDVSYDHGEELQVRGFEYDGTRCWRATADPSPERTP